MTPECSRGITHAFPMEDDGENAAGEARTPYLPSMTRRRLWSLASEMPQTG